MTIEEIITRNEDQTFDFKSILITPKALAISIVAFANADGGERYRRCKSGPTKIK